MVFTIRFLIFKMEMIISNSLIREFGILTNLQADGHSQIKVLMKRFRKSIMSMKYQIINAIIPRLLIDRVRLTILSVYME